MGGGGRQNDSRHGGRRGSAVPRSTRFKLHEEPALRVRQAQRRRSRSVSMTYTGGAKDGGKDDRVVTGRPGRSLASRRRRAPTLCFTNGTDPDIADDGSSVGSGDGLKLRNRTAFSRTAPPSCDPPLEPSRGVPSGCQAPCASEGGLRMARDGQREMRPSRAITARRRRTRRGRTAITSGGHYQLEVRGGQGPV